MGFNEYLQKQIDTSEVKTTPEQWYRSMLKVSVPLSLVSFIASVVIYADYLFATVAASLTAFFTLLFFLFSLTLLSYKKAKEVEELLPEALELISSNIRSGLPVKNAVQLLATDEFGALGNELSIVLTEESTGLSLADALRASVRRVNSHAYNKTITTLARSIETGTNMEAVTKSLAKNINEIQNIRKDIRASTLTYTMFLSFAALLAAPVLFALSTFLIEASSRLLSEGATNGDTSGAPEAFAAFSSTLPPADLLSNFFLIAIAITALFTALGVGIVNKGDKKDGIKYAPVFLITAFTVYFIAKAAIGSFLGGSL